MTIQKLKSIALSTLLLSALAAQGAEDKFYINNLNHCKITKTATNDYEPVKFQSTNNLLRGTGEMPVYCGKKIINDTPRSRATRYLKKFQLLLSKGFIRNFA